MGVEGEPVVEVFSAGSPKMGDISCVLEGDIFELRVEDGLGSGQWKVVLLYEYVITCYYHSFVFVQGKHYFRK